MTEELEGRLRDGLHRADLPAAPESLRAALDRLPDDAGPIGMGGRGLPLGWAMPVLVVIVVLALIAAWLPGGLLGPAGPTASLSGSQSPVPSTAPTPTVASPSPVDQAGTFPGGGLWAVEGSTLLLSTDAGSSWRRTTIPTPAGFIPTAFSPSVFVLDQQHAWSLTIGPGSTANTGSSTDVLNVIVNRTSDGGLTWQASAVPANLANTSPALVFADPLHGYLVGSAQRQSDGTSTVASTDDGGATWTVVATRPWLGAMVTASDASTIWAGGQQEAGGQFLQPILDVSRDGGRTWQDARLPGLVGEDETHCGCYLAGPPLFVDPATGYVTVISNAAEGAPVTSIDRTTDGGRSWTVATSQPLDTDAGVGVLDSAHWLLLVGYPAELLGTADGGAGWPTVAPGGFPNDQFTWIAGVDAHHAAALRFINGPDHSLTALYLSADRGATWLPADLGGVTPSTEPPSPPTPAAASPLSGTGTAVAFFDAETGLLAGSDATGGGSVWRTSDGGRTWSAPTALPLAQPTSVAVWGTQDAWIGVDCDGSTSPCSAGVLASSDGGGTWQRVSPTDVASLSFGDATHGWATTPGGPAVGGAAGGLLASADGGRTWSARGNPCPTGGWPASVSFPDAHNGWVGCTSMSGGGTAAKWVLGTTDGGTTWTVRAGAPRPGDGASSGLIDFGDTLAGLAMRADGVGMWWGVRGETERTTDGGRTWASTPPGEFAVDIPGSISVPTETDWYALLWDGNVGEQVVQASHDAGRTWATISPSPASATTPAPAANVQAAGLLDPVNGWVVAGGRLLVTADAGSSWRDITPSGGFGTGAGNPTGVTFTDLRHGWVAINETFTSPSDPGYGRIDVWRTTDGGASWTKTELPKAVLHPFGEILPPVQLDFLDATHGFAFLSGNLAKGANDSDIFYTADGGQTWSPDRPTGTGSVGVEGDIAFATANAGVVVNADHGNGIVVTHDGGLTWADALLALPPGSVVAPSLFGQPVFAAGGTGVVAVDFQGDSGSVTHVYRTTDAGSSWTGVATLPAGFTAVSIVDQHRWVAFNGSAVDHTDDSGATWTQTAAVPPTSHAVRPEFVDDMNGWWLAGLDNATLYATADGGATWQAVAP